MISRYILQINKTHQKILKYIRCNLVNNKVNSIVYNVVYNIVSYKMQYSISYITLIVI